MSAWTPGPWTIDETGNPSNSQTPGECAFWCNINSQWGTVCRTDWPTAFDIQKANAQLISLAPELAEALRAFVEWADGNHYPKGWANPPTLPANIARSLLARLEGGEK